MNVYQVTLNGFFSGAFLIVAANDTTQVKEIANAEMKDNRRGFDPPADDAIELLKDVTASGEPRVIAGYDWAE